MIHATFDSLGLRHHGSRADAITEDGGQYCTAVSHLATLYFSNSNQNRSYQDFPIIFSAMIINQNLERFF
jgi:hypothetical protein